MNRTIQLVGIFGIVLFVFGVLSWVAVRGESSLWTETHLVVGGLLSLVFLFRGGMRLVGGAAVRRAAGYGVGVTVYSGLCIGVLALANYFFYRYDPFLYDATEQKVNTLAPQTTQILESLKEPVLIRGFFLGGIVDERLDQLVKRLVKASPMVSFQAVDPEKAPRLVEELGIIEKDTLHFAINQPGSTRAVKISRALGEQEITNAILKLTRGAEKKIYWIYGHGEGNPEDQQSGGYLFLREAIEGENLKVEQLILAGKEKVPDDAAAVLIVAPRRDFLESERAIVRSYLEGGGNAVLLHEPQTTTEVARIAQTLGIDVGNDIIVAPEPRLMQSAGMGVQPVVSRYGNHSVTDNFTQNTVFATMASVRKSLTNKPLAPQAVVTELAFTSEQSWAEQKIAEVFSEKPTATPEPEDLKGPVSVAAAFEAPRLPVPPPGQNPTSRVVVIGDSDFVSNVNIRMLFNRDLFLNSLNWVVGEGERISIRERTLRTSVASVSPEQFQTLFLLTGILLPELLCLWGLTVWWMRRN